MDLDLKTSKLGLEVLDTMVQTFLWILACEGRYARWTDSCKISRKNILLHFHAYLTNGALICQKPKTNIVARDVLFALFLGNV